MNEIYGIRGPQDGAGIIGPVGFLGRVEQVFEEWGPFPDLSPVAPTATAGVINNLSQVTILKSDMLRIPGQSVVKNITYWVSLDPTVTPNTGIILWPKWASSDRVFDRAGLDTAVHPSRYIETGASGTKHANATVGENYPLWEPRKDADAIELIMQGTTLAANKIRVGISVEFTNIG